MYQRMRAKGASWDGPHHQEMSIQRATTNLNQRTTQKFLTRIFHMPIPTPSGINTHWPQPKRIYPTTLPAKEPTKIHIRVQEVNTPKRNVQKPISHQRLNPKTLHKF